MEGNELTTSRQIELEVDSSICEANLEDNNQWKPLKGQRFLTLDEAEQFYMRYAQSNGFDIRSHSSKKNREGEVTRKEYVCNKEGQSKKKADGTEKRRRSRFREECKARLIVVKCKDGGWQVHIFDDAHSHALISPRRRHLLKSRRHLSKAQKSLSEQLTMVNIPPHQQFDIFGVQSGGIENIGCTQQDMYNHRRDVRNQLKGHDGQMLHDHFLLEKERNPSFTYRIETDAEKRITCCFWSDAFSRQSYGVYGDVVIFDTTYNTNRYGMIFAPMMGVNNHGQTIMLSGAFLSDETAQSFNWLFKIFLSMMPGGAPQMIITDQDLAMTKSISETLPNTFHRYCSWHILNKFSDKLDSIKYSDYFQSFKHCVWASETRDEFDSRWNDILDKSGLGSNKWLQSMFDIRFKWVPAYVNHVFSADMSSSQRAESGHAYFKQYVGKNNSLADFMIQFNRGILRQRHGELFADHIDLNEKPRLKLPVKMEQQIADLYTRSYFYKFQDELWESYTHSIDIEKEDATHCYYKCYKDGEACRARQIIYDKSADFASCTCQLFQSAGIPCSHVMSFLLLVCRLQVLPNQYIKKRWTKSAKSIVIVDHDGTQISSDKSLLEKRCTLFQRSSHVIDRVILNDEAIKIFCQALDSVIEQTAPLLAVSGEGEGDDTSNGASKPKSIAGDASYNEPNSVGFKGCGKRLKKGKEKAMGKRGDKGRRCNGCGKTGVAHDKRNCPRLIAHMSSTGTGQGSDDSNGDNDISSEDEDDVQV